MNLGLEILSWVAVIVLSLSYWFQIYKIHVHKEVRDLSVIFYVMLAIGFTIMSYRAFVDDSSIFLFKQLATLLPTLIIIAQIFYHREDRWHDDSDPMCGGCGKELELDWSFCAFCGKDKIK